MRRRRKCPFPMMDWIDGFKKKRSKKPLSWIWEFTKKVVSLVTALYAIAIIFTLIMCSMSLKETGDISVLNTLITEINETFRVVVGGYLVKAGIENACKIIRNPNEEMEEIEL